MSDEPKRAEGKTGVDLYASVCVSFLEAGLGEVGGEDVRSTTSGAEADAEYEEWFRLLVRTVFRAAICG